MLKRALFVWFVMLIVASINGAIREAVLIPGMGDTAGRAVSTLSLSVLVVVLTYLTIRWIRPRSTPDAWIVGTMWAALTLAFEFLGGHFLFGNPWSKLLQDYDVMAGRIWVLVLVAIVVAPRLCAGIRGMEPDRT